MISPFTSFIYFVGLTTVYFTLKYFLAEKHGAKNKGLGIALTAVYIIVMVLLQFGTNMKNATEKCGGTPQTFAAFNYTVMPNLFIFGLLLMIMLFFPGWKSPFSNTLNSRVVAGAQDNGTEMTTNGVWDAIRGADVGGAALGMTKSALKGRDIAVVGKEILQAI